MLANLKYLAWPIVAGVLAGLLILQQLDEKPAPKSGFAAAVDQAAPAVVSIYTQKANRSNRLFDDPFFRRLMPERVQRSLGSGVIMSADGHIATNNHVIQAADQISVQLADGRIGLARLVAADPESDLAVLKIEMENLPIISIGDVDASRVGDIVLAIGNPYGFGHSVTQGIISFKGRHSLNLSTFEDYIQNDAATNPGNSGGALVDVHGRLIGLNTAISSSSGGSEGIGLAIPADTVVKVVEDLIEHGYVMRGWLGVDVQATRKGILIQGLNANGPAAAAGIQPYDLLLEVDGEAVLDPKRAMNLIANHEPGSVVPLTIGRGDKLIVIKATMGLRTPRQSR